MFFVFLDILWKYYDYSIFGYPALPNWSNISILKYKLLTYYSLDKPLGDTGQLIIIIKYVNVCIHEKRTKYNQNYICMSSIPNNRQIGNTHFTTDIIT